MANLLVALPLCFLAPPPADFFLELERLDGTWVLTVAEDNGVAAAKPGAIKIVVKQQQVTMFIVGEQKFVGKLVLDATARPKRLDFHREDRLRIRCIYELEGETLRFAFGVDEERPRTWNPGRGTSISVRVFEREK